MVTAKEKITLKNYFPKSECYRYGTVVSINIPAALMFMLHFTVVLGFS